jgi:hypothetical protein
MTRYVGDSCTGCATYCKYVKFIEVIKSATLSICHSCKSTVPSHIPREQRVRYLDRIFRKELAER